MEVIGAGWGRTGTLSLKVGTIRQQQQLATEVCFWRRAHDGAAI